MNKVTDMCRQVLCILVVAEIDAAIDSRKTRKVHIRNVTIQEKADYKYFPHEEMAVMVQSCAAKK